MTANTKWLALLSSWLMVATAASAQDNSRWVPVAASPQGLMVWYDRVTLSRSADYVSVWVKYEYGANPPVINGRAVHQTLQREGYFCSSMSVATYHSTYYAANGEVIGSQSTTSPTFEPVIPTSIGEFIWSAICKMQP